MNGWKWVGEWQGMPIFLSNVTQSCQSPHAWLVLLVAHGNGWSHTMQERLLISFPFTEISFSSIHINCTLWHVLKWVNSWLRGSFSHIISSLPSDSTLTLSHSFFFLCASKREQEVNQIINNVFKDTTLLSLRTFRFFSEATRRHIYSEGDKTRITIILNLCVSSHLNHPICLV